jgi:alpha-beta hydrolase superfamily lysophospholipase
LHFVQDACVLHHTKGWMLHGHASWEGALQQAWHLTGDANTDRWLKAAARSKRRMEPRRAVEEAARLTAYATTPVALVLSRAVMYSGLIVRWWMGRQ